MDIKQEPLDDNGTTNIVKVEDGFHCNENPYIAGPGSYNFQHMTLKEETLDIDEKPLMARLEDESVMMKCATCGQVYNLKQSFIERARIDATEESFICSFCKCKTGQMYTCNICSFKAKSPCFLVYHMRVHTKEKPFACLSCEYRASHKYKLTKHMTKHTAEMSFACSICEYRTARRYNLKCHMIKHSGEMPFACSICDYRAALRYNLKCHMRKHTGEKPYECGLCDFRTAHARNIQRHEKTQH